MAKHLTDLLLQHTPSNFDFANYDLCVPIPCKKDRDSNPEGSCENKISANSYRFADSYQNVTPLSQLTSVDECIGNISGAFQLRYPEQIKGPTGPSL